MCLIYGEGRVDDKGRNINFIERFGFLGRVYL